MKSSVLFSFLLFALLCNLLSNAQFSGRRFRGRPRGRGRIGVRELRALTTFYRYGISLNEALRRSDVVRNVVDTLQNRNLLPLTITGKLILT